jgi:hypothetical protein
MQANSDVIRGDVREFPLDWEETRCWAEKVFNKERLGSAGVVAGGLAAFLGLLGLVEYAMYQAVQSWSVSGVGASVFGFY